MSAANIPTGTRGKVAIEAIKCATQLDGLVIVKIDSESKARDMHVYAKLPKWTKNMKTFGEAGVVKEGKNSKTDDHGIEMMFVGYPFNLEEVSVRMWNPGTNRVCTSRDVIWTKQMYYKKIVDEMENVEGVEDDAAEESDSDNDSDS